MIFLKYTRKWITEHEAKNNLTPTRSKSGTFLLDSYNRFMVWVHIPNYNTFVCMIERKDFNFGVLIEDERPIGETA